MMGLKSMDDKLYEILSFELWKEGLIVPDKILIDCLLSVLMKLNFEDEESK